MTHFETILHLCFSKGNENFQRINQKDMKNLIIDMKIQLQVYTSSDDF